MGLQECGQTKRKIGLAKIASSKCPDDMRARTTNELNSRHLCFVDHERLLRKRETLFPGASIATVGELNRHCFGDAMGPPEDIRDLTDKNFGLLKDNPMHPSLHFKKGGRFRSARVGL